MLRWKKDATNHVLDGFTGKHAPLNLTATDHSNIQCLRYVSVYFNTWKCFVGGCQGTDHVFSLQQKLLSTFNLII